MQKKLLVVVLLTLGLLVGCAQDERPTAVSDQFQGVPETQSYFSQSIGSSGGLIIGDTTELDIPANALNTGSATRILMTTSVVDGSNQVEFGPSGLQFNLPCTLTIDKPDPPEAGATYHIFWYDPVGTEWVDYGGTDDGDRVFTTIDHFSTFKMEKDTEGDN